jgi:hypothetical protein
MRSHRNHGRRPYLRFGHPAELIAAYAAPDVLEISGADGAALAAAAGSLLVRRERLGATDYLYTVDNGLLLHALAVHGIELQRHVARPATLEGVFLNITGRELRD